jgi:hypothetical protein
MINWYIIYIYKRLRPIRKNPQQKKERAATEKRKSCKNFLNEIKHQTS